MSDQIFEEYLKEKEPNKYYKSYAWKTAIGLQKVDGLQTSSYLIKTAEKNINGDIDFNEAHELINSYYKEHAIREERAEEADKVAVRIAQIIMEKSFSFSPIELLSIHKRLFEGVYSHAGKIRDYNISKSEWVLGGDTVAYGNAYNLRETLEYDFGEEKKFSYQGLSTEQIIPHIARFIANLWQIHIFGEGNTRTTAVFLIKYLAKLGFNVTNDIFEKNSWYFRNALVRANYNNRSKGVFETTEYIERFLRNLLLDEDNILSNREMHIEYVEEKENQEALTERHKLIVMLLKNEPTITLQEVAEKIGKSLRTVKMDIKTLQEKGAVKRIGKKIGRWEVKI